MPFSDLFKQQLQKEITRIENDQKDSERRLQILKQLLLTQDEDCSISQVPTSLRQKVLEIVRQNPGINTSSITAALRDAHVKIGGKSKLGHRVYNELWRMRLAGEVEVVPNTVHGVGWRSLEKHL